MYLGLKRQQQTFHRTYVIPKINICSAIDIYLRITVIPIKPPPDKSPPSLTISFFFSTE